MYNLMYNKLLAKIKEVIHRDFDGRDVDRNNYYEIIPVDAEFLYNNKCCFIDGGNALLFDSPNIGVGIIRIASIIFYNKKKKIDRKEYFCVFERMNDETIKNEKIIATLISNNETTSNRTYEFDANEKNENFEELLTKIMRVMEWEFALSKGATSKDADYLFLDGAFDAHDDFMKEKRESFLKKIKELNIPTAGIAKTNTLMIKNNSYTYAVNRHSTIPTWFYMINEDNIKNNTNYINRSNNNIHEKYIAKFHPKSDYVFVLDGINIDKVNANKNIFGVLQFWSKDPTVLGYPYGLIFVDQIARISNEEKNHLIVKLSAMLKEDYRKLSHFVKNKDLHSILDSLQY